MNVTQKTRSGGRVDFYRDGRLVATVLPQRGLTNFFGSLPWDYHVLEMPSCRTIRTFDGYLNSDKQGNHAKRRAMAFAATYTKGTK